jgi:hypothetical protein
LIFWIFSEFVELKQSKTAGLSIQTTRFEFKLDMWTNRKPPRSYRPGTPMAGENAIGNDCAVPTASALMRTVPTGTGGRYRSRSHTSLAQPWLAVLAVPRSVPIGCQTVQAPIGTSLMEPRFPYF